MAERLSIAELLNLVLDKYRSSGKKHLFLTGSRDIGKTTLFNEILKKLDSYSGVRTYLKKDDDIKIIFEEINKRDRYVAAKFCNGQMEISDDFFDGIGNEILSAHLDNNFKYFVFDEIGDVEKNSEKFLDTLFKIFQKKKVISCLKKNRNVILNKPEILKDSLLIDLDSLSKST